MEREELPPITRREIDALDRNALLSLARRHAKLLGKPYPKRMEEFYCPRILDEPRLLQRLCGFGVEAFTELVLEQSPGIISPEDGGRRCSSLRAGPCRMRC